jgi:hypothetical protein
VFEQCLGKNREPKSLSKRDWDRFVKERGAGKVGLSGSKVGPRTIDERLLDALGG